MCLLRSDTQNKTRYIKMMIFVDKRTIILYNTITEEI